MLKGSNPPPDFFENHGEYSESLMSEITLYRWNYEGKTIEEHGNIFL